MFLALGTSGIHWAAINCNIILIFIIITVILFFWICFSFDFKILSVFNMFSYFIDSKWCWYCLYELRKDINWRLQISSLIICIVSNITWTSFVNTRLKIEQFYSGETGEIIVAPWLLRLHWWVLSGQWPDTMMMTQVLSWFHQWHQDTGQDTLCVDITQYCW